MMQAKETKVARGTKETVEGAEDAKYAGEAEMIKLEETSRQPGVWTNERVEEAKYMLLGGHRIWDIANSLGCKENVVERKIFETEALRNCVPQVYGEWEPSEIAYLIRYQKSVPSGLHTRIATGLGRTRKDLRKMLKELWKFK